MRIQTLHGTGHQVVVTFRVIDVVDNRGVGNQLAGVGPFGGGALTPEMRRREALLHGVGYAKAAETLAIGSVVRQPLGVPCEHGGVTLSGLAAHEEEEVGMGFELHTIGGIVTPDKTAVGEVAGHAGLATVDRQREDKRHIADAASVGQGAVAGTGPGIAGVHHLPGEI